MIKCVRVFRRVVRVDCSFIEKESCDPFSKISLHILTLHIITIRGKSSKLSSSSRRRRIRNRRKEVDHDQARTRTSSWNFIFRIGARQAPEHLRLLILINLCYYLCTAFELLKSRSCLKPNWCMFNILDLRTSLPPSQLDRSNQNV